ncbi:MAG: radical SAM protein [Candidatus Omnitrophota bacterium]
MKPASYIKLYKSGELKKRINCLFKKLESCNLCPRNCQVNRLKGQKGLCRTAMDVRVFNYMAHLGEEPPVSGKNGSGAIFFSGCPLRCVYCQNYRFSQLLQGRTVKADSLARFMLKLQEQGCHNINLVSPTHVLYQILEALQLAIEGGLTIPLVYNTSGYESRETLELLNEIVDVYLADMRYGDNEKAARYSGVSDYVEINRIALKEMYRQVGNVELDDSQIIERGLIIRHLVMPNDVSNTENVLSFIAKEISKDAFISLMSQYLPCYRAKEFSQLNRKITSGEYEKAKNLLNGFGLYNGWFQEDYGKESLAGINIEPNA